MTRRKGDAITDYDQLLPGTALEGLGDQMWTRHHLTFPPDVEPADLVVARLANELNPETRALTVRDLSWVKTIEQQIRSKRKIEQLGTKQGYST